jgi:UDP-3-O-[3-hydroxymyristoyl] glucosamine N-acyltransferase
MDMNTYTIDEICQRVTGRLVGPPELMITGVEQINRAGPSQLTFIGQKKYAQLWTDSHASAALADEKLKLEPGEGRALIHVPDTDLALAVVLEMFAPEIPDCGQGVHSSAIVHPAVKLGEGVAIGPGCVLGPHVQIGDNVSLYANVTIFDNSTIGEGTVIWPGTVIRERCKIGENCIIHPNVTIGADGFGYRPSPDGKSLVKIPQIGTVNIGRDVEIGAGTCIDRGKFSATTIGDGTKIDNLVQIAHNCTIGRACVIAGLVGISGSVTIGNGVMIGGNVGIADHISIGDGAILGAKAGVMRDVDPGAFVVGAPARDTKKAMREWAALSKLPDLMKKWRGKRNSD